MQRGGAGTCRGGVPSEKRRMLVALLCVYVFWGSTFAAMRFADATVPPLLRMAVLDSALFHTRPGLAQLAGIALARAGVALGELRGFSFVAVSLSSWLGAGWLVVFGSLVGYIAFLWLAGIVLMVAPRRVPVEAT